MDILFDTVNQILHKAIVSAFYHRQDKHTEPATQEPDFKQQPKFALLLKSPYLTYKHEPTSCPAP